MSTTTGTNMEQLKQAVLRYMKMHTELRERNAKTKELRERMNELKTVIIAYMDDISLQECNVNVGDKHGGLALRNAKRTRALKKEDAVAQMVRFFDEKLQGTSPSDSARYATDLWERMQSAKESMEVRDLTVRKMK